MAADHEWSKFSAHLYTDNVVEKLLEAGADHNHQDDVRNLVTRVMVNHVLGASVPNKVLHLFLGQ